MQMEPSTVMVMAYHSLVVQNLQNRLVRKNNGNGSSWPAHVSMQATM